MIGKAVRVSNTDFDEILEDSKHLENLIYSEDELENIFDLDKFWDGIQYLLTGSGYSEMEIDPAPLGMAFFSFQILDEKQNLGYGPAQYRTPKQVQEIYNSLQNLDLTSLKAELDANDMNSKGIYPGYWDESVSIDYLMKTFKEFIEFYRLAAKNSEAVLTYIC